MVVLKDEQHRHVYKFSGLVAQWTTPRILKGFLERAVFIFSPLLNSVFWKTIYVADSFSFPQRTAGLAPSDCWWETTPSLRPTLTTLVKVTTAPACPHLPSPALFLLILPPRSSPHTSLLIASTAYSSLPLLQSQFREGGGLVLFVHRWIPSIRIMVPIPPQRAKNLWTGLLPPHPHQPSPKPSP